MDQHNTNYSSYSRKISLTLLLLILSFTALLAQQMDKPLNVSTYVGIVNPIVSYSSGDFSTNFTDSYIVGMPTGINVVRDGHLGFSLEMVPYLKFQDGTSKMSNFLFHPGVLFPLGRGFTFIGRAAFETSGRYGITPVVSKVVTHGQSGKLFVAVPIPLRFGNQIPGSVSAAFQFGFIF